MSVAWTAYRSLAPLLGAAAPLGRWIAPAPERSAWSERLGEVHDAEPADAWIHAASMGEAVAVSGLLAELRRDAPSSRLRLTATTRTGRQRLIDLGEHATLAPLDTPQAAARFFDHVRPKCLVLLETELWPQWLIAARRAQAPVLVLNARLSARSLERYRWLGAAFTELIAGLQAVLCQSDTDRDRWLALGASPVRTSTVGNLKNDGLPSPAADRGTARAALGLDPARPLWVLGSVRPGEARHLAEAWTAMPGEARDRWQVVAVPRHANATAGLRREAQEAGVAEATGVPEHGAWRWDDRPGVLAGYYAAAELAYVGGTLEPYGGHNPLEPAACAAAVLTGPHLEAQGPAAQTLQAQGAIEIAAPGAALASALRALLTDPSLLKHRADASLAAANRARGATRRAVDRLREWTLWPR
ncbi:MAG TPA: glycosyltransferase N-terminal domain-containing protein [Candidatus Eisenbacteria bacterium]|nr:glycosyltransferase N-terminal domain-containing protein [Candidatus Eisenbacteria bacterium]